MMTQEEFMDVMAMKRQGLSITEIAAETGYHPATISSWLKNGGPSRRRRASGPPVIDEHWADGSPSCCGPPRACWPPACSS